MSQRAADAAAALPDAEAELLAWATGQRSWLNEMMSAENFLPGGERDRQKTLLMSDQRDAAATELARQKVLALRTLTGAES